MHIILFLLVVVGCSDKAADDTALTADETATEVTAGWGDVSAAANPSLVLEEVFTVTLDEPAAIAIRCTRVDRPEDVHLVESAAPPSSIPSAVGVAKGEPGAAYTLMPHQRLMLDEGSFQVHQVDVTTDTLVWSWKVEDHPDVIPSYSDANRAGIMTAGDGSQTMVISRCEQFEVIGVDMATGELAWSLGEEGTLELTAGSRPRCQHGLGVHGDRLLLYDNGARPTSRAVEYALDVEAGTIAETWSWTEDGWSELGWGDVDYLGDDRVVITRGHASGWGDEGPRRSSSWT